MNKYLIPVSLDDDIWIESIMARSLEDAKSKIITRFSEDYDLDYCDSYEDFIENALEMRNLLIGNPEDIETVWKHVIFILMTKLIVMTNLV